MASAEPTYVDPSALLKLYLHEPDSAAMSVWRGRTRDALPITPHGRVEVINGLCLATFRRLITPAALADALASFDEDLTDGRYIVADVAWRAMLRRAADLSLAHTPAVGCRTLDVLHVATALELGSRRFVTFDDRQRQLALIAGLRVVRPRR